MAELNDTRFLREDFVELIPAAHGELDEGGGWIDDPNGELTGGHGQVRQKEKPEALDQALRQSSASWLKQLSHRRAPPDADA
ncbi:hypothetical protein LPJGGPFB_05355 [Ensifer adhaerens]|nr:hypothetical protein [Ensifer adhaerens]